MRGANRLCALVVMIAVTVVMNRTPAFAGDRIEELTQMLSSSSEKTRMSAVLSLARLGDKKAMKPLVTALHDPNAQVRAIAATALGKLGHKGVELCEVVFEDAEIPVTSLLGEAEGFGLHQMLSALDRGRIYMAAASVGIARASLEAATRYATEREAFVQPIGQHQAVKLKLARMAIAVSASRLLTLDAARRIDRDGRASSEAAMAKVMASETAIECSMDAMRILGGYGFTEDFPLERMMRDAKITQIYEGTNQVQRIVMARQLLAGIQSTL